MFPRHFSKSSLKLGIPVHPCCAVLCSLTPFLLSTESQGNLHVGQEFRQVRRPTVFDISIEQHNTHENTTQWSKQEGHKPCPVVGAILLALERPHTKELSKTKA
jgi:hypothetical protein